jgi:hypothetical protein
MGKYSPKCNVIYLDQKDWICLARQHYIRSQGIKSKRLSNVLLSAADRNLAIFPLSLVHFDETLHRLNKRSRIQLASFMIKASKGYTMFPGGSTFMEIECRQAARKILGLPTIDLNKFVIGKGISHMVGAKGELVRKPGTKGPELSEKTKQKILEYVESPQTMLKLLKSQNLANQALLMKERHLETITEMERIREKNLRITDKNLRYRACLVEFFVSTTGPWLAEMHVELNLPKDAIVNKNWTRREFQRFFEDMPSLFCLFALSYRRDQLIQRPIDINDINDIWALSMAIPYCDIVVTESMWASIASQAKLDRKYSTLVLSSTEKLVDLL